MKRITEAAEHSAHSNLRRSAAQQFRDTACPLRSGIHAGCAFTFTSKRRRVITVLGYSTSSASSEAASGLRPGGRTRQSSSMKCFQHTEDDAVAVCRACGRAVCSHCVVIDGDQHILCSAECRDAYEKTTLSKTVVLELTLVTVRSYKGLRIACKLFAAMLFLSAIGELAHTFLPAHVLPGMGRRLPPVASCIVAAGLVTTGVVMLLCSRALAPVVKRYDDLVQRISD